MLSLSQFGLGARRVIGMDPGSKRIKLVLMEVMFGRARLLRRRMVDREEEGLIGSDELSRHLQNIVRDLGSAPISLALPQSLALSQVIDLPSGEEDVADLIEEQTVRLSGLSDTPLYYDYSKLAPFPGKANPFWVTLAQESVALTQIERAGLSKGDLCEVTAGGAALAAAFQAVAPGVEKAVLADTGAGTTTVIIVLGGQAVYANTFPMGGDFLTERLAARRELSFEAAEELKRSHDLFTGAKADPAALEWLREWKRELVRLLEEWGEENPEAVRLLDGSPVIISGGVAAQRGLVSALNSEAAWRFERWPMEGELRDRPEDLGSWAVAYGAALHGLGLEGQRASLAPGDVKEAAKQTARLQRWWALNFAGVLVAAVVFAVALWGEISGYLEKKKSLELARSGLEKVEKIGLLAEEARLDYDLIRPILERRESTLDTLRTLELLQKVKEGKPMWFTLFADAESYFAAPWPGENRAEGTNAVSAVALTNLAVRSMAPPMRRGFVAEFSTELEGEAMRRLLLETVAELKSDPLLENVDSLPVELRRPLTPPSVVATDRSAVLQIELAPNSFRAGEVSPPLSSTGSVRNARTFREKMDGPRGDLTGERGFE